MKIKSIELTKYPGSRSIKLILCGGIHIGYLKRDSLLHYICTLKLPNWGKEMIFENKESMFLFIEEKIKELITTLSDEE